MDEIKIPNAVIVLADDQRDERDFIRGVNSGITPVVNVSNGDWTAWLPTDEPQKYKFDTDECTQLSGINICETVLNWLKAAGKLPAEALTWFETNGYFDANGSFAFSERFIGTLSGTTVNGNTLISFWKTARKYGLLPRADHAYTLAQSTKFANQEAMCADYYDRAQITTNMLTKAAGSLQWIDIAYEIIGANFNASTPVSDIAEALKQGPLQFGVPVCIPGWNNVQVDSCPNRSPGHAIECYANAGGFEIRDHYNPFDKVLAASYYIPQVILGNITVKIQPSPVVEAAEVGILTQMFLDIKNWASQHWPWINRELPVGWSIMNIIEE